MSGNWKHSGGYAAIDNNIRKDNANNELTGTGLVGKFGPVSQGAYQRNDGRWENPIYQTNLDPDTGLLSDQFQVGNNLDTRGLNQFRDEALRESGSQSAWAQAMMNEMGQDKLQAMDDLGAQMNAAQRSQMEQLATTGGVDSGARERMARGGLKDFLASKQGVNRDFLKNKYGVMTQDEGNRMNMLQALPGMELAKSQFDAGIQSQNIDNALNERRYSFDQEFKRADSQNQIWAADKQADSQARAARASCFAPETLITMEDGSSKPICEIELGDRVLGGSKVYMVMETILEPENVLYDIEGIRVTGTHAILDDDFQWKRVSDLLSTHVADLRPATVFNLAVEDHLILIGDRLFADYDETDYPENTDEENLEEMNREWESLNDTLKTSVV